MPHPLEPARAGAPARRWRPLAATALVALAALLVATLVSCGGSGKKATQRNGVSNVTSATFTPQPPGYTPPPNPTTTFLKTQIAGGQTATADARASQTASPDGTAGGDTSVSPATGGNSGQVIFPTVPSGQQGAVYPPTSVLQVAERYIAGTVGSYNWVDPQSGVGFSGSAPWVELTDGSLPVVAGETVTLRFRDGAPTPVSTQIEVYTYNGNTAIPTTTQGVVSSKPAFVKQTDPTKTYTAQGANPGFTVDLAPQEYIVVATVTWPDVPGSEQFGPKTTQYAYRIAVQ